MQKTVLPAKALRKSGALCNQAGIFPSWLIAFATGHEEDSGSRFLIKTLLVMRLTILFLTVGLLNVHAKGISQSVTLSGKNVSLEQIFSAIETQTGYMVFYNKDDLRGAKPVTLSVYDLPLTDFLEMALKDQKLSYEVKSKTIVIMEMKERTAANISAPLIYTGPPITGRIVDRSGKPVGSATVSVKGRFNTVAAAQDGSFNINVVVGDVLVISSVGYFTKEITVGREGNNLLIELAVKTSELDEAVVVAYGSTTRRIATGAVSVIKAKEIEGIPSANIANLLQGRAAGVDITNISGSPGAGGLAITIRGYNSLDVEQGRRFSNPLWIVDGVPLNSFTSPVTGTNLLAEINPDMIESIQILKDASSAAIYGSRAANGVIIVTTKKGKKNQNAKFSVNISRTESVIPRLPTITIGKAERDFRLRALMNNPGAYLDMSTMRYGYPASFAENYLNRSGSIDYFFTPDPENGINGLVAPFLDSLNSFYNNATNFFPAYFEHGEILNGNIQTYGGSDKVSYGIGLGMYDEKGVLKGSGFQRIDLNSNTNVRLSKKLNVDLRFNASLTNRRRGEKVESYGIGVSPIIETVPGDPFRLSTLFPGQGTEVWNNVLEKLSGTKEKNRSARLRANFRVNYELFSGLTASSSLAADYSVHRRNYFQPSYLSESGYSRSIGQTGINLMALNENLLSYENVIGDHMINAVAGFSYQYDQMEYNGGSAENSPSDRIYYSMPGFPTIGQRDYGGFTEPIAFQSYLSDMQEKALISYFGKIDYNYKKKYLISASFRRDGSSVFGANNKWGTFPAFAVGWVFTEERFMKDASTWFDHGKLRASWGKSGMHFSQNYLALGIIQVAPYPFQGSGVLVPDYGRGLYNESLSWEETNQLDFGVDLDLFDQRLSMTVDYYFRYTDKMLMPVRLPSTYTGFFEQWRNAAAVSNEGIELLLNYEVIREPGIFWKTSINIARNWNRFEKSYDGQDASVDPDRPKMIIGKPLNGIYALKTNGFVNRQDELPLYFNAAGISNYFSPTQKRYFYKPGDFKFADIDGDGVLTEADKIYSGSALPFITGGLVNQFQWKNIDINLLLSFQLGRHMINTTTMRSLATNAGIEDLALHPLLLDLNSVSFWGDQKKTKPDFPLVQVENNAYLYESSIDRLVEKVNWCKVKTLSVGYNLTKLLAGKRNIEQIRLFVTGENLFTVTNYTGLDPETVDIVTGYDYGTNYPLARRFTLGLTVKF